jgi:hypothetical protein
MVARNTDADFGEKRASSGVFQRFLIWWQHALSGLVNGSRDASTPKTGPASEQPSGRTVRVLDLRSPGMAWLGGGALIAGSVATIALASPVTPRAVAISAAGMSLVWGGMRWALLQVTARGTLARDPQAIRGAWATGSAVWLLGVTPELRVLAWAVSAAVTWVVLERLGASRRQATVGVGIAWGAQAFVVIGSWLARNAIVAILAARG